MDPDIHMLDANNFDAFLKENRVVLVDFWAPWCMPCQMQGRILEAAKAEVPEGVQVAKVNVDVNPSLAQRFGVRGIPQLYLFVDGRPVEGWTGLTRADTLIPRMKDFL
ncbi:MAG: thioredoxin domain-containing protein [Candidatus Thermoplasmatota archaeon]|nr:thioredoxin domain-containing protein [Candidatus Thermoplasmatota archaeon]